MHTSRHHVISPLAAALAVFAVALLLIGNSGFFRQAFQREILASVDQSEVLGATDMVPEKPAPSATDRTLASSVR